MIPEQITHPGKIFSGRSLVCCCCCCSYCCRCRHNCLPQNLNYVFPLQRTAFTMVALINTGSLWLYEGPNTDSPAPLLVARVVGRGITALAVPDTKLVQPLQQTSDAAPVVNEQCQLLDGGAMRPPGLWNGGVGVIGFSVCHISCIAVRYTFCTICIGVNNLENST